LESEIKIKTANEARIDAEQMAKDNTVKSMIQASMSVGMIDSSVPTDPESLHAHHNQMLI